MQRVTLLHSTPPIFFPEKENGRCDRPKERRLHCMSSLEQPFACGLHCLPSVVSKRLGLLLSSLSFCLRFGSLTQFPPTLDLYRFAIACRGGFAGARRSTHYQDDMHCQMIRLHQNKMSRAAADDRSRPNRIAMLTRLRRAQGSSIGKHRTSSSCSLAMKIFSGRV